MIKMLPKVIIIVGLSGSGKSVVANYLHYRYKYQITNVGDIVQHKFKTTGLKLKGNRKLQEELEKIIEKYKRVILIGAREKYYIDEFKKKYNALVIVVQAFLTSRYGRLSKRGLTLAKIGKKTTEETEIGINEAIQTAHFIIENNGTLPELKTKLDDIFYLFTESGEDL